VPFRGGSAGFAGNAAVLYLPAEINQGVALFTDVSIIDPARTCRDGVSLGPFYPAQQTPFWIILLACALPFVDVAVLVWWLRWEFGIITKN
jgi:hypothetical protein